MLYTQLTSLFLVFSAPFSSIFVIDIIRVSVGMYTVIRCVLLL